MQSVLPRRAITRTNRNKQRPGPWCDASQKAVADPLVWAELVIESSNMDLNVIQYRFHPHQYVHDLKKAALAKAQQNPLAHCDAWTHKVYHVATPIPVPDHGTAALESQTTNFRH
jgi:hypothetical protein